MSCLRFICLGLLLAISPLRICAAQDCCPSQAGHGAGEHATGHHEDMAATDHHAPNAAPSCSVHCAAGVSLPAAVISIAAGPRPDYIRSALPERPPLTIPRPPDRPPTTRPA